jgi:hypothetical protein
MPRALPHWVKCPALPTSIFKGAYYASDFSCRCRTDFDRNHHYLDFTGIRRLLGMFFREMSAGLHQSQWKKLQ